MVVKKGIRSILHHFGYEIRRIKSDDSTHLPLGQDPFLDIKKLTSSKECPVIFDVGANVGQTIENFRKHFSDPVIHAFEPGADTFQELQHRTVNIPNLHLNNVALGSNRATMEFFQSSTGSELDSLLKPSIEIWGGGGIKGKRQVPVSTVDDYCLEHAVNCIDILKTDTQGFDFEVIKGATGMLQRKLVHLVYMEILFSDMYKGQARMDEIYGFLMDHGFVLITFYPFYYWGEKASWTEALFVQPEYKQAAGV